jgi:hypothetical protein
LQSAELVGDFKKQLGDCPGSKAVKMFGSALKADAGKWIKSIHMHLLM